MVWLVSSPAVANISGRFWFDRRPRPTAVRPGTRVTPEQRRQLARWLAARPLDLRRALAHFWTSFRVLAAGLPPRLPRIWHV